MSTLNTTNLKNPSSGSNNIVLAADGSTTIPTLSATDITGTTIQGTIKSGTAVASTSGTAIDFTGIPSWVKKITVMFSGVSTNGTSNMQIQLGNSGGIETTGYVGLVSRLGSSGASSVVATSGALFTESTLAANTYQGSVVIANLSGNAWVFSGLVAPAVSSNMTMNTATKTLSDTLDRIRITTVNGTNTFDAGSINILYEG
jgi:hypothetical protein